MKRVLHTYLALLLALTVAITAHGAASAQGGQDDATGQMVLCTGTGPVVVYVDAEGQPTRPPHVCPDCVMHMLDAVSVPDVLLSLDTQGRNLRFRQPGIRAVAGPELRAMARGPPVSV